MGHPAEKDTARPALDVERGSGYAEALVVERDGYLARGLTDRAAQVDDALANLGVMETTEDMPESETTGDPAAPERPDPGIPEKATPAKPRTRKK